METNRSFDVEIWGLFNVIRGRKDWHTYLLPVFFLKYISDDWDARRADLATKFDSEVLIERRMQRGRFVVPEIAHFNFLRRVATSGLGSAVNNALILLEQANQHKLTGIFKNIDYNTPLLSGTSGTEWISFLDRLIKVAGRLNFNTGIDIKRLISTIFSLSSPAAAANAGYHFAPDTVVDLLVELTAPKAGDRIYDPSCNFGNLLVKAAGSVKDKNGNPSADFSLFGQGISDELDGCLRIYLIMCGLDDARISPGDPIRNPILTDEGQLLKFDVLVSNLPWNIDKWGIEVAKTDTYNRFQWGLPPEAKGDWGYIQHMLAVASERGRIGVIVPHGLLFREGRELIIRKAVVENNFLEGVVSLPSNLFYTTKAPCVILLFNKNKGRNKHILFIDAAKAFKADKRQNSLREEDLHHILSAWNCFGKHPNDPEKSLEMNYSTAVPMEAIAANNYNLNVARYIVQENNNDSDEEEIHTLEAELCVLNTELIAIKENIRHQFLQLRSK